MEFPITFISDIFLENSKMYGLCVGYDHETVVVAILNNEGEWIEVLDSGIGFVDSVKRFCRMRNIDTTTESGREELWKQYDGSRVWVGRIQ